MKLVIIYDNDGYFKTSKQVDENYHLAGSETFIIPPSDLYNPRFNGTAWVGMTREEFDKLTIDTSKVVPATPSASDKAINALGLQVAALQKQNTEIAKSINELGLEFAKSHNQINGGNQ